MMNKPPIAIVVNTALRALTNELQNQREFIVA